MAGVVGKLAIITEANRQLEAFHRARAQAVPPTAQ
jgi:hypothetical protein